jgi:hypothetical protein
MTPQKFVEVAMARHVLVAVLISACLLGGAPAYAGPCTAAIAQLEKLVGKPTAAIEVEPSAPQTLGAQLGHQPTPASVGRADELADARFDAVVARAKRLDARGDGACVQALDDARLMLGIP